MSALRYERDRGSGASPGRAAAGLYGEHYKLLHDMTDATRRKSPLISDEVNRQVKALGRLKAKVQIVMALQGRDGHLAVLDTNVLMHYYRPDKVPWAEVLSAAGPARLILPICVLDDLDNKKYTGSDRMSG